MSIFNKSTETKRIIDSQQLESLLCYISMELTKELVGVMPLAYNLADKNDAYSDSAAQELKNIVVDKVSINEKAVKIFNTLYINNKTYFNSYGEISSKMGEQNDVSSAVCNYNTLDIESAQKLWKQFCIIYVDQFFYFLVQNFNKISPSVEELQISDIIIEGMANKIHELEPLNLEITEFQRYFNLNEQEKLVNILKEIEEGYSFNPFIAQEFIKVKYKDPYPLPLNGQILTSYEGYIFKNQFKSFIEYIENIHNLYFKNKSMTGTPLISDIFSTFEYGIRLQYVDLYSVLSATNPNLNQIKNNKDDLRKFNQIKSYYTNYNFDIPLSQAMQLRSYLDKYSVSYTQKKSNKVDANRNPNSLMDINIPVYPIDEITISKLETNYISFLYDSVKSTDYQVSFFGDGKGNKELLLRNSLKDSFNIDVSHKGLNELREIEQFIYDKKKEFANSEKYKAIVNYCIPSQYLSSFYLRYYIKTMIDIFASKNIGPQGGIL